MCLMSRLIPKIGARFLLVYDVLSSSNFSLSDNLTHKNGS